MSSVVYQKLEKPTRIMFVAPLIFFTEIALFLLLLILSKEPVLAIAVIIPTHLSNVRLTNREPHINNILRNAANRLFDRPSDKNPKNKTPLIFKENDVRFYYEL